MAPSNHQVWKQLKIRSKAKLLPLFYSYEPSKGRLSFRLTDLVSIWQCDLSKANIVSEASQQHCSIDPSESSQQLDVFLSKLGQSVEGGNNLLAHGEDVEDNILLLRTQISLPRPLQPLVFTFTLKIAAAADFSSLIVQPLLDSLSARQSQLTSLGEHLKAKDHVIAKLLDRIGNQGLDMSVIFPTLTGAGGRKGNVTVEMAKKRIPGMDPFDYDVWLQEIGGTSDEVVRVGELIKSAQDEKIQSERSSVWVDQLPDQEVIDKANASQASKRASQSQSQVRSQQVLGSDGQTASEDDFETQVTPPSLRKKKQPIPEDNVEGGVSSQNSSGEDSPPPSKKRKSSTIGGIGKRKPPANSTSVNSSSSSPAADRPKQSSRQTGASSPEDTNETASGSESEPEKPVPKPQLQKSKLGGLRNKRVEAPSPTTAETSPPPPPSRPASSHASTPSHRLGRLGKGRQRTATASPAPEEDKRVSQPPTPSHRLGRIGMRKGTSSPIPEDQGPDSATASEDDDLDGPITKTNGSNKRKISSPDAKLPIPKRSKTPEVKHDTPVPEPTPTPVETEDEKAARKKEELRKKIASGPAKKKRRF